MSFSWNLIMRTTQKFYTRVSQKKMKNEGSNGGMAVVAILVS